jgi:4'-phosphopantetheinyl transferase
MPALRFNASQSAGLALVGVALGREVGVDVERLRGDLDVLGVARRALEPDVVRALEETPADHRGRRFFDAWTRHEARQKCSGVGIGDGVLGEAPISLMGLALGDAWAGAVAVEGPLESMLLRTWW